MPLDQVLTQTYTVPLLLALILYVVIDRRIRRQRNQLWQVYQQALRSGNKQEALRAGRAYYYKLRGNGNPRRADEEAIANDLSTMS